MRWSAPRLQSNPKHGGFTMIWESEMVAANRVAAINPLIDDTDPIRKFSMNPWLPHGPAKPSRILSKREADTEFQYRPHIVDTDTIADAALADAISETSRWSSRTTSGPPGFEVGVSGPKAKKSRKKNSGKSKWGLSKWLVTGEHWTGSPNKSIDQIGKNCPKNVRKLCFQPLQTIFGHFSDIFSTFCRHSLFLGCPMICPLQPNGGLRYLSTIVHDCLRLSSFCDESSPQKGAPKRPHKCTIVDDCAQIAESGLKSPFESPHLDFPERLEKVSSRVRKPWSANRELRDLQRRGCRDRCQEGLEKGAQTVGIRGKKGAQTAK